MKQKYLFWGFFSLFLRVGNTTAVNIFISNHRHNSYVVSSLEFHCFSKLPSVVVKMLYKLYFCLKYNFKPNHFQAINWYCTILK